ncbi:hypothetical protein KM043_015763 [Ampulex compressa]|nr:hypothetical protein KM043_015763 [Ampulex compressa]
MTTAVVEFTQKRGNRLKARVLLDSCSTVNLMTERFTNLLKLFTLPCAVNIGAVDSLCTVSNQYVRASFFSACNKTKYDFFFLIVPNIDDFVPNETFPRHLFHISKNLKLTNSQFHVPKTVGILLASRTTLFTLAPGQVKIQNRESEIILQKTALGWVVAGGTVDTSGSIKTICNVVKLHKLIERFWIIEDFDHESVRSRDDVICEEHYVKHTSRDASGRYVTVFLLETFALFNNWLGTNLKTSYGPVGSYFEISMSMILFLGPIFSTKSSVSVTRWASNHHSALNNIDQKIFNLDCGIKENPVQTTLGIAWNTQRDILTYTVGSIDVQSVFTKRRLLSESSRIFDPLGLCGPVILFAKLLIQDCWKFKITWDESLLQDIFSRTVSKAGKVSTQLICNKSRVAPLSGVTIPRLELCAASVLNKLFVKVKAQLDVPIKSSVLVRLHYRPMLVKKGSSSVEDF